MAQDSSPGTIQKTLPTSVIEEAGVIVISGCPGGHSASPKSSISRIQKRVCYMHRTGEITTCSTGFD